MQLMSVWEKTRQGKIRPVFVFNKAIKMTSGWK